VDLVDRQHDAGVAIPLGDEAAQGFEKGPQARDEGVVVARLPVGADPQRAYSLERQRRRVRVEFIEFASGSLPGRGG
jgi:hypothetical protein